MEGNDISGWAPEKDLILTRHSPWEWPGFSTLQDKLPLDAHLARTLDATGRATEEETTSYAAMIEEAERGPVLSKLYEIIDQPDEKGVRDKKLTPAEFQAALGKPWLAQQLSLLISQHESEWFWNESKWNQLDKLMEHTPEDPNPQWVKEKERIKTLSWWKELAGQPGIAADGVAWHFQPIWLSASLSQPTKMIIQELRVRAFMRMIRVGEGTVGPRGYEKLFGGSSFIKDHGKDFSDHPQIKIKAGGYVSSAAGAYQVMGYTWSDANYIKIRSKLKIQDFSPESQDRFGVVLLRYATKGNALKMIIDNKIKEAIESCSWIWASLPPSRYGQPIETMEEAIGNYENFLKEEKSGETDLHIKPGFLEEFGY